MSTYKNTHINIVPNFMHYCVKSLFVAKNACFKIEILHYNKNPASVILPILETEISNFILLLEP